MPSHIGGDSVSSTTGTRRPPRRLRGSDTSITLTSRDRKFMTYTVRPSAESTTPRGLAPVGQKPSSRGAVGSRRSRPMSWSLPHGIEPRLAKHRVQMLARERFRGLLVVHAAPILQVVVSHIAPTVKLAVRHRAPSDGPWRCPSVWRGRPYVDRPGPVETRPPWAPALRRRSARSARVCARAGSGTRGRSRASAGCRESR